MAASTRLSDLPINNEYAVKAVILRTMATNAFVNSGVLARDAQLDAFLSSELGGKTISPVMSGRLPLRSRISPATTPPSNPPRKRSPAARTWQCASLSTRAGQAWT